MTEKLRVNLRGKRNTQNDFIITLFLSNGQRTNKPTRAEQSTDAQKSKIFGVLLTRWPHVPFPFAILLSALKRTVIHSAEIRDLLNKENNSPMSDDETGLQSVHPSTASSLHSLSRTRHPVDRGTYSRRGFCANSS